MTTNQKLNDAAQGGAAAFIAGLVLLLSSVGPAHAQGFINLDFEQAQIVPVVGSPIYPYTVVASNALPGWTVYYGSNLQSVINYQDYSLGATQVTLLGAPAFGASSIEGNYSVLIQGGVVTATDASIRQTGLVPASAESIEFKATAGSGPLLLSLGGQNIPFYALSTGSNYTLYGGDVSAFTNTVEQLDFSAPEGFGGNNNWNVDSIVFSPNPIPEPETWALLVCGAGVLLAAWRSRQEFNQRRLEKSNAPGD